MSFTEAVRSALTKYATFSGRARRSEYWLFSLFAGIAVLVPVLLTGSGNRAIAQVGMALYWVALLGLFLPGLAVSVRRLHDTNRSGWWFLLNLVPFGSIVVFVFSVLDGDLGANDYGPPSDVPVLQDGVVPAV